MTADANILINFARQSAQGYLATYNEDIPCEMLVKRLCDLKQGYTQHGGKPNPNPNPPPLLPFTTSQLTPPPFTPALQVSAHSVYHSSTPATTPNENSNFTKATPPATTAGGKPPQSGRTMPPPSRYSSKTTRKTVI